MLAGAWVHRDSDHLEFFMLSAWTRAKNHKTEAGAGLCSQAESEET